MQTNIFSTCAYFTQGKWSATFGRHPEKIYYIILRILPMVDEIPETPIKVKYKLFIINSPIPKMINDKSNCNVEIK